MQIASGDSGGRRLRVVQWTTGIVGASALRGILEDPRLELVGVHAHSPGKAGTDAGTLVGIEPVGVVATIDIDAVLALNPDCVVYMPQWPDIGELERLLMAGINVVTTARLVNGRHYPGEAGERLARAAAAGRSSLFGTGMNPMHIPTVALASTAMCRRVHHVRVLESVDCGMYGAAATWEAYGFGTPLEPDRLNKELLEAEPGYKEALDAVAEGFGVRLDDYRLRTNYAVAAEDRQLEYMFIAKGTVSALDAVWEGRVDDKPFVEFRTTWTLGSFFGFHDEPEFPILNAYEVTITGEPNIRMKLNFMPEDLEHIDIGITTAMPAVNAIPSVCAAPPGVLSPTDLTLVTARGIPRA